jgi:hypothetical protein
MGKIKQGILGGFNGKTGSVVGASWKGIAYMRGKAQSIKNPRTQLQQENREKFGGLSEIMSLARPAINKGFKAYAVKQSAFNYAVRENMSIEQGDPFKFSKGSLYGLSSGTATRNQSTLTIEATTQLPAGENSEAVFVVVGFSQSDGRAIVVCSNAPFTVGETSISVNVTLPTGYETLQYQVYGFVYNKVSAESSNTSLLATLS